MINRTLTEDIANLLRDKKIQFSLDDDTINPLFTLYVGSSEGNIQIEYSNDVKFPEPCLQIFSATDNKGYSLFEQHFDFKTLKEVEGIIEELVEFLKTQNRVIAKIEAKIDQIKELAKELNTDYETFITINYDFEN